MQFAVSAASGTIHCQVDGPEGGAPLLLMHALGTRLELWDGLVEALARTHRTIRYDMRGHGRSSVPAGEYALGDLGGDAVRVLDATGVDRALVCGISIGGLTAMWLGIHRPERVRALVIANTAAKVGTPERWVERAAKVHADGMGAIADLAMTNWFTPGFRQRDPATVARFHAMVAQTSPEGYARCCAVLRDADLRPQLGDIQAPAVVIAGEQDPSTPLADAELIRDRVAQASLVALPAAHLSNIECPAEFAGHVGTFLDTV